MQTTCPQCSQGIILDDAKIPDRPFSVKCPRCRSAVHLSGKGAAPGGDTTAATPVPGPSPANTSDAGATPPPQPAAPTSPSADDELRAQITAQVRREMTAIQAGDAGRALVSLPNVGLTNALRLPLVRLGFSVDVVDEADDAARRAEQGNHRLLATARVVAAAGQPPTLFQRLGRLSQTARRQVFVVLVGEELKTGDGTQAFAAAVDLVVHPRDLANCEIQLHTALAERQRLYQTFLDAQRRHETNA